MKKNILWILGTILAVTAFIGIYFLYNNLKDDYAPEQMVSVNTTQAEAESPEPIQTTADFTVFDRSGNAVRLSDYFGKPIVLNFWASWCPPCKAEMPHFEAAYLANPDVQFLMVNMTSGDNMDNAKSFLAESGYTFPVLFDTTGEAGYVYQASSLPMTMFIDERGVLVTYAVGALDAETLARGIEMINPDAE